MADFDDIRRGLAANLAVLKNDDWKVRPFIEDKPTPPYIGIAGIQDVDYDQTFRGEYELEGDLMVVVVEACVSKVVDLAAQKRIDRLHGSDFSLKAALEADASLTSRMADDGTVTTGHAAVADALRVRKYLGQQRLAVGGIDFLFANWEVELFT